MKFKLGQLQLFSSLLKILFKLLLLLTFTIMFGSGRKVERAFSTNLNQLLLRALLLLRPQPGDVATRMQTTSRSSFSSIIIARFYFALLYFGTLLVFRKEWTLTVSCTECIYRAWRVLFVRGYNVSTASRPRLRRWIQYGGWCTVCLHC